MKRNRPTCSSSLHARLGEQLGLSPRSSGRVGGLSAGAERTRRSVKGARLSGRDNRKQNSDPSSYRGSGGVRQGAFSPCRYRATRARALDTTGNSATRLACEFQRTEWRRHVSEHETTGTKKHPSPVAPRPRGPLRNGAKRSSRCRTNVATEAGGWMSKLYSCRSGGEQCFL